MRFFCRVDVGSMSVDVGSMLGRCEVDVRLMWGRCRNDVGSIMCACTEKLTEVFNLQISLTSSLHRTPYPDYVQGLL